METQITRDISQLSVEEIVLSVVLLGSLSAVVVTYGNPVAIVLPLAGGLASGGLIWSIDKLQAGVRICIPQTQRCVQTESK